MEAGGEGKKPRGGEEWRAGMDRDALGEVIPARASAKRRPGTQGAAWRRRASRRPPPAPTGEEEDDTRTGPGPGERQVVFLHFFLVLFSVLLTILVCYLFQLQNSLPKIF